MDENKILGLLRTSIYESSFLDLIRELMRKVPMLSVELSSFKKLPVAVQDYLEGHITAWALFELLLRLPTFQTELRNLVVGSPARESSPSPGDFRSSEFHLHRNRFDETMEVALRHGRSNSVVAALAANGEIEVATSVHVHGLLTARELNLSTLTLRGRPMIRFEEEVGYLGETRTVEHFIFRCPSCGGIFTYDDPTPQMYTHTLGGEPMYICRHCYTPNKEEETDEQD